MKFLGIESSCDETSVAVYDTDKRAILSTVTFSQDFIHNRFGGVIPEVASRNHIIKIKPLFDECLKEANLQAKDLDAIGVTVAPGLIGALFIGVTFAKSLGYILKIPVVPVHHLSAHILASEVQYDIKPPYLGVVLSGGHTHIFDIDASYNFRLIARTIDDAVGEVFDKVAKVLGGPYPGGRYIEELAKAGDEKKIKFPIAFRGEDKFSFSGLKTSVINKIKDGAESREDIVASFQYTVAKTVADKASEIAFRLGHRQVVVGGGVASNSAMRKKFEDIVEFKTYFPSLKLCTDNADMIAYTASVFYYKRNFLALNSTATDRLDDIR